MAETSQEATVTCGLRNGRHICEQPDGHTDGYHRSSAAGWHCPWPSEPCPEDICETREQRDD